MKYLVLCTCGHGLDRHGESGCGGDGPACGCRNDELQALDAAIEHARQHPWGALRHADGTAGISADDAA